MEKRLKRKFNADFKAKVVLEALKERTSIQEIARKYELTPSQIVLWKKEFLAHAASVFSSDSDKSDDKKSQEAATEKLFAQIGQLKVENDWLKKKLQ